MLSKGERNILMNSSCLKQNKVFDLDMRNFPCCLLETKMWRAHLRRLRILGLDLQEEENDDQLKITDLVERLHINISRSQHPCRHHGFHDEVFSLILSLTTRFDNKKLTLTIKNERTFDLDKFMAFLSVRRPDLIFERFNYLSNPNAKQDCINGLELLFSKCESLYIDGLYCKSLLLHPNLNQFVLQLRKLKVCNSHLEQMLSLPEERRPTPSEVKLHSEYETDFINFAQVEILHLK